MGNENDGCETGGGTAKHRDERQTALNGNSGMARAFRGESDRHQAATDGRAMKEYPESDGYRDKDQQLNRNLAEQIALAQRDKRIGKSGEIIDGLCDSLCEAAKEGE